ncbi:squalene/phytoene synthase family protein [Polyangium jinanense]|uniref:Squalene/phytoene synthase family protein n=1 Tax=Polyangium jinanense TaxID=2829994 RepID=A0A9X3XDT4_9BACT|nr:squalene/phytoene synthase family protein [Polyangium jinanense]MDC3961060.1 squalene/phytoene synthase family protein [Polyangium jinanense]MDC3987480.1 squalene/phytoene synthase family protein [Polyangium jinanense]
MAAALEALAAQRVADRDFCVRTLPRVSRTFALSILSLPEGLSDSLCAAYLLCRIVDSIEDANPIAPETRVSLFDAFDALMRGEAGSLSEFEARFTDEAIGMSEADRALCKGAGAVFRVYRALPAADQEAIRPWVLEMSRGMREYAGRADAEGKTRIRDVADLERYCYFVAGTVGELLTALFERAVPTASEEVRKAAWSRATRFGLGLQMVNVLKDVAEDLDRGACFLPEDVLARHGVRRDALLSPEARAGGLAAVSEVCTIARGHLDAAVEYTLCWPGREGAEVRAFCAVPLALAIATLREVERGEDTLVRGREPKIDKRLVAEVLAGARRAAESDSALTALFARAAEARPSAPAGGTGRVAMPLLRARRPPVPPERRASMTVIRGGAGAKKSSGNDASRNDARTREGRVLVTGGAGHLGQNLVRRLVAEGKEVRVLVRGARGAAALAGLPVEVVTCDVRDADALGAATRGVTEVYHAAAMVAEGDERAFFETNVLGTRVLLDACREAGVRRVVVTSSLDAVRYDDTRGAPIDEATPLDPFSAHSPHARTKALAEHECLKAVADGLDVVVVAPTTLVGPFDDRPSAIGRALVDHANGRLRAFARGALLLTSTRDAVEAHLAAMRNGRKGQKYVVATELVSIDDLLSFFEEASARRRPPFAVPALLARTSLAQKLAAARMLGGERPPGAPAPASSPRRADTSKAERELGFVPTCVRSAIYDAYADFFRRALVPEGPASRGAHVARP